MARFALHLNDAAITLVREDRIVYREPGFALLDDGLATGREALGKSRIDPRSIQHRYWYELGTDPLPVRRFAHMSAADLAIRQLEQAVEAAGGIDGSLVVAVPGSMQAERLSLFLGIAQELGLPVSALVDAAVAATRREYRGAAPVHVDISLHAAVLSRIAQPGRAQLDRVEVLENCGLNALHDAWLNVAAEAFVRQSRFDPLHTAETEQALFDTLTAWTGAAAEREKAELALEYRGIAHSAEVEALALIAAAAPVYQRIASTLRAMFRAEELPALQVTDRVSRLPGLAAMLSARVGGEVFALEPGATARGALARCEDPSPASEAGVRLRRQLPWDRSAVRVSADNQRAARPSGMPTHVLYGHKAWEIGQQPLTLGSQPAEGRSIALGSDMPGVSRRHCSIRFLNGRAVLEDHSRYGTFLNGHRIDGSTVLQVGDAVRIGSPGYELRLITTDESHGA